MNQLVLFGPVGFTNLGDKLLADYYRAQLYSIFPEYPRQVVTVGDVRPCYSGETLWHRRQVLSLLSRVVPGDLWIAGGGSLLQNRTSRRSLLYYLCLLELAAQRGARIVMLGQGYGPVCGRIWAAAARHGLSRAELIECRDALTYHRLKEMRLKNTRILRGTDPIWGIDNPGQVEKGDKLLLILRKADRYRVPKILAALSSHGWRHRIKVVALDGRDEGVLRALCGDEYRGTADEIGAFWSFAAGVQGILSTRLHGIILGALAGLPAIGLGDDPKITGICQELGLMVNPLACPADYAALPLMVAETRFTLEVAEHVQTLREQALAMERVWKATLREIGARR
jgi:polysaccharide pyruvyl transferase WcaK-like protein